MLRQFLNFNQLRHFSYSFRTQLSTSKLLMSSSAISTSTSATTNPLFLRSLCLHDPILTNFQNNFPLMLRRPVSLWLTSSDIFKPSGSVGQSQGYSTKQNDESENSRETKATSSESSSKSESSDGTTITNTTSEKDSDHQLDSETQKHNTGSENYNESDNSTLKSESSDSGPEPSNKNSASNGPNNEGSGSGPNRSNPNQNKSNKARQSASGSTSWYESETDQHMSLDNPIVPSLLLFVLLLQVPLNFKQRQDLRLNAYWLSKRDSEGRGEMLT